ncbi:MAG: PspC domain-containing protein [Flavobacteriaceae bacterium]|jgi:phage shock protein PspC (stress-responsive transcriptional regulator)|nr:PspC domain-containing protein [Flavobacteriaceae bacterium]
MNKTVNINLGGIFFHIDEDAYQKLSRYFDAVKSSLSGSSGKDEIMKDIEDRIAEIFSENRQSDRHVIGINDVEDMIVIMGQPEDYKLDEEDNSAQNQQNSNTKKPRKLYRDIDKNFLGGVAAGFGHYLGVDALWIRLLFIIIVISGWGYPILIYILLWVLIPKALTTGEKLEMTGEPVNLSNIKKKAHEEFSNFSEKIENADYDKMGNRIRTGAEEIGTTIGRVFIAIFAVFAKILGAFIVLISFGILVSLLIGLFVGTLFGIPWQDYINVSLFTDFPLWILGLTAFLSIGIPFFFLLILGLKLLINNMKSIGNITKYTLLALWIISTVLLISLGIKQATKNAYSEKTVIKEEISLAQTDTLYVKFRHNETFSNDVKYTGEFRYRTEFKLLQDENKNEMIYSNYITLRIKHTDEATPYMLIDKSADGSTLNYAKNRAENILYNFSVEGNQIVLDNYYLTDVKNKYRNQKVVVSIFLPEGYHIKPHNSVKSYFRTHYNDMDFNKGTDEKTYKVKNKTLNCVNCPTENEINTDTQETDNSISIEVNKNGLIINKESDTTKFSGLKINQDGIIIKSN